MLNAHPKVIVREWDKGAASTKTCSSRTGRSGIRRLVVQFDWVMIPDSDEFIYSPDMLHIGSGEVGRDTGDSSREGYNIVGDGFPKDDGHRQI